MNPSLSSRARAAAQSAAILITLLALVLSPTLPAQAGRLPQETNPPVAQPQPGSTPVPPDEQTPPGGADPRAGQIQPTAPEPRWPTPEEAISAAVFARIAALQENELAFLVNEVEIDSIQISLDGLQAVVWLAFYDRETGILAAGEPGLALAALTDEGWQVTLQIEEDWQAKVENAPAELITAEVKTRLVQPVPEVGAAAGTVYKGYKLPWAGGTYNYISGSIGHVLTYKSCPSTCMYAYDFADGTMFKIYAAKAGRVKYAQWKYANGNTTSTNYLVLEDASTVPTTYQVYYHLAKDSIPTALRTAGALVNQGQFIGNADDTGYSTGHHLHFHVHTTTNAVWGASVDIQFADVPVNSGRPRTCAEAAAYPSYGSACLPGNKYLSGNKPGAAPAAPTPLAPKGNVYTANPTLEWSAVSGGMQYYLLINVAGKTGFIATQLVNASSACSEGKCKAVLATSLAAGSYQFRARVGSETGWSPNSAVIDFTVKAGLEIPEQVSPSGVIHINNPRYTWKPVTGADRYYLMVYSDKSATDIIYRTLMAADVCGAATCGYISTINVTNGSYKWKVRAGNTLGWSAYSPQMAFSYAPATPTPTPTSTPTASPTTATPTLPASPTVTPTTSTPTPTPTTTTPTPTPTTATPTASPTASPTPLPPELVSPVPEVTETAKRPTYRWKAAAGATSYSLQVYSVATAATLGTYVADSVYLCTGEACSWRVALDLTNGKYRYRVRAAANGVWGDYSAYKEFTVQLAP